MCFLYHTACLLHLRERLQPQKVHLNQSRALNHVAVILGDSRLQAREIRVVGGGDRHMGADRIAADDESAGVYASASDRPLQLAGVLDGVRLTRIRACLSGLQFGSTYDGILQVHL